MTAEPTLPAALARAVALGPGRDALVTADARLTWGGLDAASRDVASALAARGVSRRTRVGLLAQNGLDWAVCAFAVLRLGAVLVPLSTLLRAPELERQLRVAAVERLVLVDAFRGRAYREEFADLLPVDGPAPRLPALRSAWALGDVLADPARSPLAAALEARVKPADDLAILFTSGSRGAPKGVVHTHGNALRAVTASLPIRRVGPTDRLYIPMPFFWTGGFAGGLLTVLAAGATLVTEAVPEPETTLDLLVRERVTLFRGWPDQAARLAVHPAAGRADLSALRPASLPALLPDALRPAPGARANLFGMTETFGPYCGDPLDEDMPESSRGSCGTPFPGVGVSIADPGTGAPVPVGEHGEIRVRGPHLMRGICGRSRESVFTPDGWYRTGDLGHLDPSGRLWHHGRLDDMIKINGATVYPSEVESALASLPGVHSAHVTSLPGAAGPILAAAVIPTASATLTEPALREHTRALLSPYKVPRVLHLLAPGTDIPRTPTGKPDLPALRELLGR
ncbi:class I adenylate-forming enzyme family protein [Actinocorallia aurea]